MPPPGRFEDMILDMGVLLGGSFYTDNG